MTNKKIFPSKSKILLSFTPVSILLLLVLYFSIGGKFTYFGKSSEEIKATIKGRGEYVKNFKFINQSRVYD